MANSGTAELGLLDDGDEFCGLPYHVFFELRRSHDRAYDLGMVVESAYPEDPARGGPNILGKMGFVLLCGKVYTGKPVATKR